MFSGNKLFESCVLSAILSLRWRNISNRKKWNSVSAIKLACRICWILLYTSRTVLCSVNGWNNASTSTPFKLLRLLDLPRWLSVERLLFSTPAANTPFSWCASVSRSSTLLLSNFSIICCTVSSPDSILAISAAFNKWRTSFNVYFTSDITFNWSALTRFSTDASFDKLVSVEGGVILSNSPSLSSLWVFSFSSESCSVSDCLLSSWISSKEAVCLISANIPSSSSKVCALAILVTKSVYCSPTILYCPRIVFTSCRFISRLWSIAAACFEDSFWTVSFDLSILDSSLTSSLDCNQSILLGSTTELVPVNSSALTPSTEPNINPNPIETDTTPTDNFFRVYRLYLLAPFSINNLWLFLPIILFLPN